MTDRINALTVILTEDIRDDDVQNLVSAIHQMRSVLTVKTHVSSIAATVAEERVKRELLQKMFEVLK